MASEELNDIIEDMRNKGKMAFIEGASGEQLETFQKDEGLTLPAGYREWLSFSDGGEIFLPAGIQFYGVAHKPLINVNDDERPNDSYVVIGALCTGDPVLCDKEGERVSIYNHEGGTIEDDEVYDDFISFLKDVPSLLGIEE